MSPSSLGRRGRSVARAALFLLPLLLAACAARVPTQPMAKYVAPASGPSAKLVMRGHVNAGDSYGMYIYDDAEKCAGLRALGAGNSQRNPLSTSLEANRIQTVEFFLVKPNRQFCTVRWTFTPVVGKTYLLSGSATTGGCAARVLDMSDPDDIKPELTALRRNPGTTQCLPLSLSKGSSVPGTDAGHTGNEAVLKPGANADDLKGLIGQ